MKHIYDHPQFQCGCLVLEINCQGLGVLKRHGPQIWVTKITFVTDVISGFPVEMIGNGQQATELRCRE